MEIGRDQVVQNLFVKIVVEAVILYGTDISRESMEV
jgi:hypothetical protein